MIDGLAESLRVTSFPAPDAEFDPGAWWRTLLNREPDTRVTRPAAGEWREEGEYEGGQLRLSVNAAAVIEWKLAPAPLKEVPAELPTVGRFVDAYNAFYPLVRRWFDLAPPLQRLAFGAVVLVPVATKVEGYRMLSRYLPDLRIDAENTSDLLYQINRRRRSSSGVDGLEINRLSKWAVAQMRVAAQPVSEVRGQRTLPPLMACRVELDINTAPEFPGHFSPLHSVEVFDELVALGREILATGDLP